LLQRLQRIGQRIPLWFRDLSSNYVGYQPRGSFANH
jgi:hypothetical protein